MPRRLHDDLSTSDDGETRRRKKRARIPSDKKSLADLRPLAAWIVRFTEREREILQAWLTSLLDPNVAAINADCSPNQVWNVLRKLRRWSEKKRLKPLTLTSVRLDKRKARRIHRRSIMRRVDQRIASDFRRDPMGTARKALGRKLAAQQHEPSPCKPIITPSPQ